MYVCIFICDITEWTFCFGLLIFPLYLLNNRMYEDYIQLLKENILIENVYIVLLIDKI